MDLFRNGSAQVLKLGFAAKPENALDYASLLVQQHRVGQPAVMIDGLHVAAPHQNGEWRPELGDKCPHLGIADVVRDGGDIEVLTVELFVQ